MDRRRPLPIQRVIVIKTIYDIEKTTIKAIAVKDTYWNSDQTSKTVDGRVYTVNFKSNGGSSVSKQYVQYNKVIKKPSNPKRSKYTFAGWYTDSKLTKAWDFNTKRSNPEKHCMQSGKRSA